VLPRSPKTLDGNLRILEGDGFPSDTQLSDMTFSTYAMPHIIYDNSDYDASRIRMGLNRDRYNEIPKPESFWKARLAK